MATAALALLLPASALAAGQSLAITSPTGFPAGGDPSYTSSISLDSSAGTPSNVTLTLAPGVLASPSANPSCLRSTQDSGTSCEIGTGSVSALGGLPVPVTAYLAPPPSPTDVVGIDIVPLGVSLLPTTHAGGQLVQTASGNVQTVLSLSLSSLGPLASSVTGMSLTVNGTLEGKPFNRMPTNCSPGKSQLTVVYTNKTETTAASADFAPTGCKSLPYSPQATATAHLTKAVAGTVVQTITQSPGQAASVRTTLTLPKTALLPNLGSLKYQNTSTPVGSAVATTPLLPTPLRGKIYFKGTLTKPFLIFKFPPPAALTLRGNVNLSTDSVTIPVIPDVPLTRLQVTFPGGPYGMLVVGCPTAPAALKGVFVGQNGTTATSTHPLTVTGC